ncbi:MAG: UDP-N-acetylmuramoyl-tripeptide--D-alanyl-D-alanine ligase [Firmicutes bacterium]|nr:UDP-N-acetylmuramoyl-tripeptide--D-alanyl-D-alanine ligase [Bacillota bacterium]
MFICAYLIMAVIYLYSMIKMRRSLHMLQQNLYNENNRYLKWVSKNKKEIYKNLDMFGLLFTFLFAWGFNTYVAYYFTGVIVLLYIVCTYLFIKERKKDQNKKPLVITSRIKRLIITTMVLYLIPCVCGYFIKSNLNDFIFILSIMAVLNFYVVFIAKIINSPIEKLVYKYYESKAKRKLASMPNLKVIGITGSYGKTSSKNILADVLNVKFNALPTPKSLNTFNGLMITVNNKLTKFDDCFIAEMGAYVKGEINGLCELVNPKYGIITSIGTAHLATFGSEKNILDAKMELIEYLPKDGIGVLNRDDEKQKSYVIKKKDHCRILWIGIDTKDEVDVRASNIKCNNEGTSFICTFKGDKNKYEFHTRLLGKHNVYNIIASLALGYEFGISIEKLQQAVRKIKPVEHRLEIKPFPNFYQIDDAYNSNPVGAKGAVDVLGMMDGMKVVVTPGMVELGEKEEYYNKEFGKQIAEVADKVILVGAKKTKPILEGLKEAKFKEENIDVINDVREAYKILNSINSKKKIYALFENDLPDTYNEK